MNCTRVCLEIRLGHRKDFCLELFGFVGNSRWGLIVVLPSPKQLTSHLNAMRSLAAVVALSLVDLAIAASRTSPPSGCLVVSKSPSGGQYATVSAAVAALSSSSSTAPQCIFVYPGTYAEQVLVPASLKTSQLSIYGSTTDTSSYAANTVTLTSSLAQAHGLSNDETATLRVKSPGFRLYNVNVNNGYGKGSQAVAVSAQADSGYYGCAMTGFQDTLLANSGRQVFARCLIQGATDFVFGRRAAAWFESCDVRVVAASLGYVTGELPKLDAVTRYRERRVQGGSWMWW